MRSKLWVVVVAAALLTGCQGGGADVGDVDLNLADPSVVEGINDLRMPEAGDTAATGVEGLLTIKGFTILDPEAPAVAASVSQLPDIRVLVRLIDPDEDILREVSPDVGGRFSIDYDGEALNAKLQVEFRVEEDLDGDGKGEDMLTLSVPVSLKPGRIAQVELSLARQETEIEPGVPIADVADQALLPETGEMMIVRYMAQDANGYHNEYYGVLFASGQTVFDQDGDEFLEAGDDFVGADTNNDGWIDIYETGFASPLTAAEQVYSGTVINVHVAQQTLTLELESKETLLVLVDPFTPIEPLSTDSQFFGELPLDASLIGRRVQVSGRPAPEGVLALWIVVLESDPPR